MREVEASVDTPVKFEYRWQDHLRIPMVEYAISLTDAPYGKLADGALNDGVRLGTYNYWLALYGKDVDGRLYTVWGSFMLDRIPEFCGGTILYGVRVHSVYLTHSNGYRTTNEYWYGNPLAPYLLPRKAIYSSYPKEFSGGYSASSATYLLERINTNTCELPCINTLLGSEHVSKHDATTYMTDVIGDAILSAMYRRKQRVLMSADTVFGGLTEVISRLTERLRERRGRADLMPYPLNSPYASLRAGTLHHTGCVIVARAKVSSSPKLRNWNSDNDCSRHTLLLTARSSYAPETAANTTAVNRITAEATRLTSTKYGDLALFGRLLLHAPLRMPAGDAISPL